MVFVQQIIQKNVFSMLNFFLINPISDMVLFSLVPVYL